MGNKVSRRLLALLSLRRTLVLTGFAQNED